MKKSLTRLLIACAALGVAATSAFASGTGWTDNYEKAATQAKKENKLLLLDFTGSDWCGWCIKLNKEVFSQQEFKDYAAKNLVLVEVDFPQTKTLPAGVQQQNEKLQQQYRIEGFPTIVVLNGEGKKVGELGYQPGGPAGFISKLESFKK